MRVFLGFPASDEIRSYLQRTQALLAGHGIRGKWVDPRNAHLTVLFLGEQSPETVRRLRNELASSTSTALPPVLECGGVGAFPPRPRLLFVDWHEVAQGRFAPLVELAGHCAASAGIPMDAAKARRRLRPHMTLVRFRGPREARVLRSLGAFEDGRWAWTIDVPPPPATARRIECDRLVLYESHLRPAGPVYGTLDEFTIRRPETG